MPVVFSPHETHPSSGPQPPIPVAKGHPSPPKAAKRSASRRTSPKTSPKLKPTTPGQKRGTASPVPYWASDHPMRTVAQPTEWRDGTYETGMNQSASRPGTAQAPFPPKTAARTAPRKTGMGQRGTQLGSGGSSGKWANTVHRADSALYGFQTHKRSPSSANKPSPYDLTYDPNSQPASTSRASHRPSTARALDTASKALDRASSVAGRPVTARSSHRSPHAPMSPKSPGKGVGGREPMRKTLGQEQRWLEGDGTPVLTRNPDPLGPAAPNWSID